MSETITSRAGEEATVVAGESDDVSPGSPPVQRQARTCGGLLDEVTLCARAAGIDETRVNELADFARQRNLPLVEVLVERGGAAEGPLLEQLAALLGLSFLARGPDVVEPEVLSALSPALAVRHHVMPLEAVNGRLRLACANPFGWELWDELAFLAGKSLDKVLCPRPEIERMLRASYGLGAETVDRLLADRAEEDIHVAGSADGNLSEQDAANAPTVVNLVNQVLADAIRARATDIHLEPHDGRYRIRYRIDGMLEDVSVPASVNMLKLAVVSRIKIMSGLDITEKRLPQDGRCQVSLAGQDYDLRISILPGVHGEAVVVRLQTRQMGRLSLEELGFEAEEHEAVFRLIRRPHGLMLVTGPTGSGKTTTLYACLSQIITPISKIITVEDPVEYRMEDILQMQIHEEIGFTFARALRSILRHDPDILLIGEIRDRETADIAIRASLTGHLVFATLHTNDAASSATRLIDIGIEPFLVASSLNGVLAQRLVRKVCEHCREPLDVEPLHDLERRLLEELNDRQKVTLWRGRGCEKCRFTGYRGRMAVGEALVVGAEVRKLISRRVSADEIAEVGRRQGMRSIRTAALEAVSAGRTTLAEVVRVTQEEF